MSFAFECLVQQLFEPEVCRVPTLRGVIRSEVSPWANVTLAVIERPSEVTAIITWKDSTSGSYLDQVWRQGVSRQLGLCALTGKRICPGDSIYRPIYLSIRPSNADAMIHTAAIHAAVLEG